MIIGARKKIFVAGFILISRFFCVKFWRVEAAEDPLYKRKDRLTTLVTQQEHNSFKSSIKQNNLWCYGGLCAGLLTC